MGQPSVVHVHDLHPAGSMPTVLDPSPAPRPSGRPLEGRFYSLRPIDPAADAAPLYSASHGSPEGRAIWTYLWAGPFGSAAEMRTWLEAQAAAPGHVAYTVVERPSGHPVGGCHFLNIVPSNRALEIGGIHH
jgi:RimJ/RimL family protein N-acetyltransferase